MIQFDIITIFPNIFDSYFKESIIKKAKEKGLIKINIHNLRNWAKDSRRTVDDRPYGGGIGMVFKVEPVFKAVEAIKKFKKRKIILFTPRGKKFNQKIASKLTKLNQIIMICGRYEGVDERVSKHIADLKLSIGDYVLMGGELAAMILIETMARLVPGVLGKPELLRERIKKGGFIEYSQYTRPEIFEPPPSSKLRRTGKKRIKWRVPKILLSGDHKKIEEWRRKYQKLIGK